jgi:enolase
VADEGGFWPEFASNEEPLALIVEAMRRAGYTPGREAAIALDVAASDLFQENTQQYRFRLEKREFGSNEFASLMEDWCARYPIVSIEDPMADVDWKGWERTMASLGEKINSWAMTFSRQTSSESIVE